MEIDEVDATTPAATIPFQLQFDKPIASQVKIAEWNPEKDLLAMVTDDSKILLHRFNWQRLWTVSPGRCITSLCWRPDGKAIAVGLEDGTISLHDVENGKLLRNTKSHSAAVVCLNWEEDMLQREDDSENGIFTYEDRTSRFFPSAPRMPQLPGLGSVDAAFLNDNEDAFRELSNSSHHRFNILCSGDKDGSICFSIFGIFPIGKINIHKLTIQSSVSGKRTMCQLINATICKVSLSKNLCEVLVLCHGKLVKNRAHLEDPSIPKQNSLIGLHCVCLDTSVFRNRKNELHQVARQASNIENLMEVIKTSLSLMHKQWCTAMQTYHDKFDHLSSLIINHDHGYESTSQEEFLSLLGGARTSPPLHQFLVTSLGEVGLKRVAKIVDSASKELHLIIREHLQPAVEIIVFRLGELKGLSRWRARYHCIGLDEKLMYYTTEKAGILLVQVERFLRVLAGVSYQFQNFFAWLARCIKSLMGEPSDQLPPFNSELIVIFLKFLYNQDPVRQLLENSEVNFTSETDLDTMRRIEELVKFGGFSDTEYLRRSLAKEFEQMDDSLKTAFLMPFTTVSKNIYCQDIQPLCPISSAANWSYFPASTSFYKDVLFGSTTTSQHVLQDYICFQFPDDSRIDTSSSIGIARGFTRCSMHANGKDSSLEVMLLHIPHGLQCVDLSLYKEKQVAVLLNETTSTSDSPGQACLMILETSDLPFMPVSREIIRNSWIFDQIKGTGVNLHMESCKVRCIPHSVTVPLAVSASRGVACVFASRKRALVYILEEDEDEASDME